MVPIGFVSDHIEVAWDLDMEAVEVADEIGLPVARPRRSALILDVPLRELVCERIEERPTAERWHAGVVRRAGTSARPAVAPTREGPRPAAALVRAGDGS